MICRQLDARTHQFLEDDGETEVARVVLPEGGCTIAELERFLEYLKREAKLRTWIARCK